MKIVVVGLGYVGAVTSCCLARDGHDVVGVDLDQNKLDLLAKGVSPIIEQGIDEVTQAAFDSGRLKVDRSLTAVAIEGAVVFVCVGTPSADNGSQDLTAIERVCRQLGELLRSVDGCEIVIRSTIPAGTTEGLLLPILEQCSGKVAGDGFGLAFQPEFLREGSSVSDFYNPPMTVVGGDERSVARLRELFGTLPGEFIATDVKSAELLKVACNTFHALKVNFANEIGRVATALDMDARIVMELLCRDKQLNISPAYLRPGFAFGGSCLPKDLRALLYTAKSHDVELPMLSGILPSNDLHIELIAKKIMAHSSRQVGFVGLSFKQGTDDLRESPLVRLAEILIGKGYAIKIYDPAVSVAMLTGGNKKYIETTIPHFAALMSDSLGELIAPDSVVIVAHKHDELESQLSTLPSTSLVFDLVGLHLEGNAEYQGVAW